MARFTVKESSKSKSKRTATAELTAARVTVGNGAAAGVRIKDSTLAGEHFAVRFEGGRFFLEDLGSATGTYLDGREVKDPAELADGSRIVAGTSAFDVRLDRGGGTLVLERYDFHFDYEHDPLRWTLAETKLGRYPFLRGTVWVSVLIGVAAVPVVWWSALRGPLLSPGPVAHLAFLAGGDELAGEDGLAGGRRVAGGEGKRARSAAAFFAEEDCSACHRKSWERVGLSGCTGEACHDGLVRADRHPFAWGGGAPAWVPKELRSCTGCHLEHRGQLVPPAESTPGMCGDCHGADVPGTEAAADRPLAPPEPTTVSIAYAEFSHAAHAKLADCTVCHKRAEGPGSLDFAPVLFANCMKCHGDPANPHGAPAYKVAWHGAGEECLRCHVKLRAKELREAPQRPRPERRLFALRRRPHVTEAASAHAAGEDCTACHRSGIELEGGGELRLVFDHRTHAADPSGRDIASCERCHAEVSKAESLSVPQAVYDASACGECHTGDGTDSLVSEIAQPPEQTGGTRRDFPHAFHRTIEGGCGACHAFEGGVPQPVAADIRDCTRCHDRTHRNIGGGDCARCHQDLGVYSGEETEWQRPLEPAFRHWSPGHWPTVEQGDCSACHDTEGTYAAARITALPVPVEADRACRGCHIDRRARFHWR